MAPEPEARKVEEAEFHDRLRGLYEKDPEQYSYFTSNKKFYSVVRTSDDFYFKWLRETATGKRVLDFGCGSGAYSVELARFAQHVTGIDISPEAIKQAEEHAEAAGLKDKTTFTVMDAEALEFDTDSFDVVSVRGVLHHMDLNLALGQIQRVLTKNGKAIFLEALADNPIIHAYRKRTPHLRTAWETDHILRSKDAIQMRRHFKHVDVRYFHLAVLAAVPLRRTRVFSPARAALEVVDRAILRVPGLRRNAWMACFLLSEPIR
ncbi:MAG TPA: class I SAM-dependent methyltransferase [Candidatus Dormibacteraeota bacterium]|nr:class I SAM-dependent methyltransferase [Candidatus Dormibacteraeota bacterium]